MTSDKRNSPGRGPRLFDVDDPQVTPTPPQPGRRAGAGAAAGSERPDVSDDHEPDDEFDGEGATPSALQPARRAGQSTSRSLIGWGGLLLSAFLALATLAASVWFARFVSVALDRTDFVGTIAWVLLAVLALSALVLLIRELVGFLRLARIGRLRQDAEELVASPDRAGEERLARRLKSILGGRPETRWDLQRFREEERHAKDPGALLGLADRTLLATADRDARRIIFESARRVAVVTAVVPVAFLVVLFVLFENVRMLRRLAASYGGRPGLFGGLRLLWRVIAHIAATGALALTDDLLGQFLGQDLVRRVSRRLGEGAFNGALTARLGVAALDICRPLPFISAKPIRARGIVRELFPEINAGEMVRGVFRRRPRSSDTGT